MKSKNAIFVFTVFYRSAETLIRSGGKLYRFFNCLLFMKKVKAKTHAQVSLKSARDLLLWDTLCNFLAVVKVDRRIRWHYTTTILCLRIGARLTRYRNCKFHNFARTISRNADDINRYAVPPSAGSLLPLLFGLFCICLEYIGVCGPG